MLGKWDASVQQIIRKTSEYLAVPSVVGFEASFLHYLAGDLRNLGLECELTARYLLVAAREITNDVLLSIHVDRHGLITTAHGDLEYAAFVMRAEKYQEEPSASLQMLNRIRSRFLGEQVFAYDANTGTILCEGIIEDAFVSSARENMVFVAPQLKNLPVGTPISYGAKCDSRETSLRGQLDNAISVAIAFNVFSTGFGGRVLFTCEEEIGHSWQSIQTVLERGTFENAKLIVMDTSPFATEENHDLDFVVLRNRDAHSLFDPALTEELKDCAERSGIPVVFKDSWIEQQPQKKLLVSYGSTELGRLIKATEGRWNGTTLQIPTLDYHTNRESASFAAIKNIHGFLAAYLRLNANEFGKNR